MSTQLQELLNEFGCNVLNFTNNKIIVDHFYNEERYNDFLKGKNCRQGMGMFDENEQLIFNTLNDNILVIVQKDGIETARYKFETIFKATLEFREKSIDNKYTNRTLTFKIRKNQFKEGLNYIDTEGNSLDFESLDDIKDYLRKKYGSYKLTDWGFRVG